MKTLSDLWDLKAGERVLDRLRSVRNDAETFLENLPDHGRALLGFLIFSPISLEKIVRDPHLLEWLSHSDVANRRPTPRWRAHDDLSLRQLRSWKSQEMLRIAFRELTGLADFVET
ncbi:MAG: hypothetical protein JOY96_09575, partial [Verrucomicrobia bacterium]|nr:hypothetical protein [Verrucomicrobiota bacterium]